MFGWGIGERCDGEALVEQTEIIYVWYVFIFHRFMAPNVVWRHEPSLDNPADIGSCGSSGTEEELRWSGPLWLSDSSKWPPQIETRRSDKNKGIGRKIEGVSPIETRRSDKNKRIKEESEGVEGA